MRSSRSTVPCAYVGTSRLGIGAPLDILKEIISRPARCAAGFLNSAFAGCRQYHRYARQSLSFGILFFRRRQPDHTGKAPHGPPGFRREVLTSATVMHFPRGRAY